MSIASFHAEWLNLIEIDGPFLTLPVLTEHLRSGLEPTDSELVAELHTAQREVEDDRTLHPVWTRWVITRLLGFPDEVLREGTAIGPTLKHRVAEHGLTLRPDFAIVERTDDGTERARLVINIWPAGTDLTERPTGERWAASPIDRTAELCRATQVRLGLVTNGDTWIVVDAPVDATTGTATWDATLWAEERTTLDAFVTLLGVRRFFTVADNETLEALLAQSANAEAEVTDQLGKQVRAAVELLVDSMSRADRDRAGSVFRELAEAELDQDLEPYIYEAAVTVLMRLVFLLSAEERGLFLLGDPTYDSTYSVSTLLAQLDEHANRYGEDVLERRTDAWHRLLATFRMVHAGAAHANLRLPPYGGSLFDPDRFPFLEGRRTDQPSDVTSTPLWIDNRTIKHILDALQVLRFRGKGGWQEARRLSFRTLGVEQIGHVYEGLLDHGVVQVTSHAVALTGKNDPEVALSLIEEAAAKGHGALVTWLAELTGDSAKVIEKAVTSVPEPDHLDRLASACDNDTELAARVAPYLGLLRTDLRGLPQVYLPDSYYVTKSSDRRSSGAYYTPRSLAEDMVTHTLEPLVYKPGPAEGAEPGAWTLESSVELLQLRVCDMAMGSGAFLVAACRYLSERLLEAWDTEGLPPGAPISLPNGATTPMPDDETDREILARRLVADRCLYGVDRNPMAVEMAKLSLWLVTLAKDRPFTFVDHALRCGDSLLGITDLRQLDSFHIDAAKGRRLHGGTLFDPGTRIEPLVKAAVEKRRQLESFTVIDIADAEAKRQLLKESDALLDDLKVVADVVIAAALSTSSSTADAHDDRLVSVAAEVANALDPDRGADDRSARLLDLKLKGAYWLDEGRPPMAPARRCLHWPLEFPEVFDAGSSGFDAIVGNPPFLGNKYWKDTFGASFQGLVRHLLGATPGKIDLAVVFHRRAYSLLAEGMGSFGLLGSTQSAEGQAVEVGLGAISSSGTITRAVRGMQWPGDAKVRVNLVWVRRGPFEGDRVLNGAVVASISPTLGEGVGGAEPDELAQPDLWAFEGVHNGRGACFLLAAGDPWLERIQAEGSELLRPYISGEDLGARPLGTFNRWVVDAGDAKLDEIRARHPVVHKFLKEVVEPQRTPDVLAPYKGLSDRWWQFWNTRAALFRRLRKRESCVVLPKVAMYVLPVRAPTAWCFTNQVVVIEEARGDTFGVLRSLAFCEWMTKYCTSFGVGGGIRPSISKGVNTFVMPPYSAEVEKLGDAWDEATRQWCEDSGQGLTALQNAIHAGSPSAESLAAIQVGLDRAVAAAYGWTDIELDHAARDTPSGARFSAAPSARVDVLERLLVLNHARYAAEDAAGLHIKRKPARRGRNSSTDEALF